MAHAFDFSGRIALVTGSSRGIGAGIVGGLNAGGARCVVVYVEDVDGRNRSEAEVVAAGLDRPLVVQCDVGDEVQVEAMVRRVGEELGRIDILVNNAGILRDRSIKKMSHAEWDDVIRINLTGAFHCIQKASPLMTGGEEGAGGRIVNIASVAAYLGMFGQANYASAKAGLIALTKVAAHELAKQGITVNAVAPGVVDTEMTRGMPAEAKAKLLAEVPLGRVGTVEDVVHAVLFLCSEYAGYITGQVVHVNGGMYMP